MAGKQTAGDGEAQALSAVEAQILVSSQLGWAILERQGHCHMELR